MPRISVLLALFLGGLTFAVPSQGQLPLGEAEARQITPTFDAPGPNALKCSIDEWRPSLDFAFRFVVGYVVRCPLGQFEGKKSAVVGYLRVTPEGKPPALFASVFHVPELAPDMQRDVGKNFRRLKNDIGMSGAIGVGEGKYSIEVLVTDDRKRSCHKKWKVRVARDRSQRDVPLALQPLTVEALNRRIWPLAQPQQRGGIRLTVLLDAAPVNRYQSRLRAWDRSFLLQSTYSLLRQTPYKSVRLIAFNLEQQREIYRNEKFDSAAFEALSAALRDVETASISVQALKKRNSSDFIATLANKELTAPERSDAIIFLGPNTRDVKMTSGLLHANKRPGPLFFYFEYYPWPTSPFPDEIERLIKSANGRTFQIHNPAQFDQSIGKMLTQLKQE